MKNIINDSFMLKTDTARKLYHEHAEGMPIIDYHNHLSPREICEDRTYENMTAVWLGGDHYKWRAMRAMGYPEELVTGGSVDDYKRFLAYADTVQSCVGNPLYHWTHLELKRYFDIDIALTPDTAEERWKECNRKLNSKDYSTLNLLRKQRKISANGPNPSDDYGLGCFPASFWLHR